MKLIKKMLIIIVFVFGLFVTVSCDEQTEFKVQFASNGGSKVETIVVAKGEKATKPKDPTYEGYKFAGWFESEKFEGEQFNFDVEITKDIILYAKWEEVQMEDEILVVGASLPSNYVLFLNNKKEKENKKTEFYDLTKNYVVGDDNEFSVKPDVTFVKYDHKTNKYVPIGNCEWEFGISLSLFDGNKYNELSAEEQTLYVEKIDNVNATIDFSLNAIGKSFKIVVSTKDLSEDNNIELEVEVVDGLNVYNAKDLAYMENRQDQNDIMVQSWTKFKEENNMDKEYTPANMIFHKNISITAADLPAYFFYTADEVSKSDSDYNRVIGSMRDNINFYFHESKENETFNIFGNYFTLSCETLKEVVREYGKISTEGEVISHTTLFRFEGSQSSKVTIEELNIIGNAPRVENTIKAGGQIFTKVEGPEFKAYNMIASCFFIAYFPNNTRAAFLVEKCKAYDSFNCFIYNWGSDNVTIKESEMIGAGGPIIIQDHINPTSADGGRPAKTRIENCHLESYVTGQEGWFTVVKAAAVVPTIKQLDALFTPFNKSILKYNADKSLSYLNLICVNKSGDTATISNQKIEGELAIDDATFNYGKTNPYLAALLEIGAPVFQSSASTLESGYAYTDGATGLYDVTRKQIIDPTNAIYKGDYLTLYYSGMMLVFGYNQAGEVYTFGE